VLRFVKSVWSSWHWEQVGKIRCGEKPAVIANEIEAEDNRRHQSVMKARGYIVRGQEIVTKVLTAPVTGPVIAAATIVSGVDDTQALVRSIYTGEQKDTVAVTVLGPNGDAYVNGALLVGGLVSSARGTPGRTGTTVRTAPRTNGPSSNARLPQDINVNPEAPGVLPTNRPIGPSPTQNAQLQGDIAQARSQGATDFRVDQQQVNAAGQRVGVNRPDLQYTDAAGRRVYVEYDSSASTRGPGHQTRIQANDPNGRVIGKTVD
jgi:hypothetical protein